MRVTITLTVRDSAAMSLLRRMLGRSCFANVHINHDLTADVPNDLRGVARAQVESVTDPTRRRFFTPSDAAGFDETAQWEQDWTPEDAYTSSQWELLGSRSNAGHLFRYTDTGRRMAETVKGRALVRRLSA